MAKLSHARINDAERRGPQLEHSWVIEEMIVESVDGRMGRKYLAYRAQSLPRKHIYREVITHFPVDDSAFTSDVNSVVKRVWGSWGEKYPPGVCEIWDPAIPIAQLPIFDVAAAVRWRIQCPSEWEPWSRYPHEKWVGTLVRLASGATG
jgi:hypothetical protein